VEKIKYYIKYIFTFIFCSLLFGAYPDYDYTIIGDPYPAKLFVHSMSTENPHIGILNEDLSIYWEVNHGNHGFDFRKNNHKLSFFDKTAMKWIIADQYMQEIDTVQCTNGKLTDYHDIRLLDNGGYILQCYDSTWVDLGMPMPTLIQDILIIQEFNNEDSLILNWNALDYLAIQDYPNINFMNPQITFMHGNSIEIDFDNNLLLSNRTSNEIFKIDRNSGDIIWIMGGPYNEFTFINDRLDGFNKQHDVRRIDNGNITLFDNGTQHNPMLSRAVEYQLDEIEKTATLVWEYVHPDSLVAMSMGSVQRLPNNNTLINWGFFFETNILNIGTYITEVDYDKNTVLSVTYPPGYYAYRARKADWEFDINLQPGDTNLDGILNVLDIIHSVNYILFNNDGIKLIDAHKIDVNTDGEFNVIDLTEMINDIISQ
tara:strand:- start:184 stop:1467 length:1284 start_codon:yes stop_codon:yes gene_type:complete